MKGRFRFSPAGPCPVTMVKSCTEWFPRFQSNGSAGPWNRQEVFARQTQWQLRMMATKHRTEQNILSSATLNFAPSKITLLQREAAFHASLGASWMALAFAWMGRLGNSHQGHSIRWGLPARRPIDSSWYQRDARMFVNSATHSTIQARLRRTVPRSDHDLSASSNN